jgi:hypothetical protein
LEYAVDRPLIENAIARAEQNPSKPNYFVDLFVMTGFADSMLWLVVGIAIGKFLL